jgi:L-iditol 2-dehydrogenase
MKALVKISQGYGDLEVRDVEDPELNEDQVLIEVKSAGICGSDVSYYKGSSRINTPVILGHESSGIIVKIGENVEGWGIGEKVTSETSAHVCGRCYYCRTGDYHLCVERKGLGSGVNGVFARYVAVPTRLLHKIPDRIPFDEAAMVQPCADIVNAVTRKTHVYPGDTVIVLGPGPMGLLTTQVAKASGAGKVIQTGHRGVRLDIAKEVGADETIVIGEEDPVESVMAMTDGLGADIVFEASGSVSAAVQAFDLVRKGGQITFIASPNQPVELELSKIMGKSLVVRGSIMSKWVDYERAIKLISGGEVRVKPIITHRFPITEWERAFDTIINEKTAGKVMFTPV